MKRKSKVLPNQQTTAINKAVCYVRVSTLEQSQEGVSLDAQEERLKAYCQMSGFEIVRMIREEGVSGGKAIGTRPGGAELLDILNRGEAQHVVALKLDRLFRDSVDALQQTQKWYNAGISLHLVDMGGQTFNTGSAMGKFILGMMAGFAELERALISERTAMALAHKREHNQVYSKTPYGFDRQGNDLVENAEEVQVIARLQEMRNNGMSYWKIADILNAEGIPTKQGKKWYAATVRKFFQEKDLAA